MKRGCSRLKSLVLSAGVVHVLFTPLIAGAESPISKVSIIKAYTFQALSLLISFVASYLVTTKIESVLVKRWNPKLAFGVAIFIGTAILFVAFVQATDVLVMLDRLLFPISAPQP